MGHAFVSRVVAFGRRAWWQGRDVWWTQVRLAIHSYRDSGTLHTAGRLRKRRVWNVLKIMTCDCTCTLFVLVLRRKKSGGFWENVLTEQMNVQKESDRSTLYLECKNLTTLWRLFWPWHASFGIATDVSNLEVCQGGDFWFIIPRRMVCIGFWWWFCADGVRGQQPTGPVLDSFCDHAKPKKTISPRVPNLALCPGRLQRPEHPLNLLDWNQLKWTEINWRWSDNPLIFLIGAFISVLAFVQSPSWIKCVCSCSFADQSALWAGSFVYSRKPVLSAESEAKAKAITEKNGASAWISGLSGWHRV